MGNAFSAIIGGIIFAVFVYGLADSIGAVPFYIIVVGVIGMMVYETFQEVSAWYRTRNSGK